MRLNGAGQRPVLIGYDSLPVGVVTLAERFGHQGFSAEGYRRHGGAREPALLAPFERIHCIGHEIRLAGVRLLGTSGTVTTLAGRGAGAAAIPAARGGWADPDRRGDGRGTCPCCAGWGGRGLMRHPCVGPGAGRVRAARLRDLRGDPEHLERAGGDGGGPRAAGRDAAADDPGQSGAKKAHVPEESARGSP